jgi:hypothetical protein
MASFVSSYIPTVASQVTRAADNASMIGNNFARWYNVNAGTLYAEAAGRTTDGFVVKLDDNTISNNRIQLRFFSDAQALISSNNINQCELDGGTVFANTDAKFGFGFQLNDFALSLNGAASVTDTLGLMPVGVIQMRIGNRANDLFMNGTIKRISYFNRRLADSELIGITS